MKKSLCLLSVALFALSSCSKDDKKSDSSGILPKTVKFTYGDYPKDGYTATYAYDGNKIKSITYNDGFKKVFTYTGDVITKEERYGKDDAYSTTITTFTYDNNKLKSYLEPYYYNQKRRADFSYNADGTISRVYVIIDSRGEEKKESPSIITLDKGNIVKNVSNRWGVQR